MCLHLLKGAAKGGLLVLEDSTDGLAGRDKLREEGTHVVCHNIHQLGKEALLGAQDLCAVADLDGFCGS